MHLKKLKKMQNIVKIKLLNTYLKKIFHHKMISALIGSCVV